MLYFVMNFRMVMLLAGRQPRCIWDERGPNLHAAETNLARLCGSI